MKRILLYALLVCLALVGVSAGVVALQPANYRIVRSATITASPSDVFALVNDFHKWEAWSPWAKLDPEVKNTFEGPPEGTGAIFKWTGNEKVGEGLMTLKESRPNERIRIKLEFIRPFPNTCDTEFSFQPQNNLTVVTWSMAGHKNFISKAVCMFMDMDQTVGGDFEKGLANMKSMVEKKQS